MCVYCDSWLWKESFTTRHASSVLMEDVLWPYRPMLHWTDSFTASTILLSYSRRKVATIMWTRQPQWRRTKRRRRRQKQKKKLPSQKKNCSSCDELEGASASTSLVFVPVFFQAHLLKSPFWSCESSCSWPSVDFRVVCLFLSFVVKLTEQGSWRLIVI